MRPIILIPARMASQRLPGKPLADIHGKPMIVHVMERAFQAGLPEAEIIVACAEQEIADAVEGAGGTAILTDPNHASGTDRIYEAFTKLPERDTIDLIINLQGDLPTLSPNLLGAIPLFDTAQDFTIGTFVFEDTSHEASENPNAVKAVLENTKEITFDGHNFVMGHAVNFTREPAPTLPFYHHIGIYVYTREALEKFVSLPPSPREQEERLEQLRALENNMRIDAIVVDSPPFGVDTPEDLEKARELLG